jgi:hypothetical protein
MNRIHSVRRCLAGLTGLAGVLVAYGAAAPAALATPHPTLRPEPPGWNKHPPLPSPHGGAHTVVTGGMPGWQIILIAVAAALVAALLAVIVDRTLAARRRVTAARAMTVPGASHPLGNQTASKKPVGG